MSRSLAGPPVRDGRPLLLCLPHAGGGPAAFARWPQLLGRSAQVAALCPPGRGTRYGEPCPTRLEDLVHDLAEDLAEHLTPTYALYGHSMGGLVAHALGIHLSELAARGAVPAAPMAVVVAGCRPPGSAPAAPLLELLARCADPDPPGDGGEPDAGLVAALRRLGGIPPEILGHAEWLEVMLPAIRADLHLCVDVPPLTRRLTCEVLALAGTRDPIAAPEWMRGWARGTTGRFRLREIPAEHFFHQTAAPTVTGAISGLLGRLGTSAVAPGRSLTAR